MREKDGFFVKSEDVSRLEYGKYPGARSVEELVRNGLIILDKWPGPTSHDVVATVKKLFALPRAGHSGTLDPAVSGVLPIALDNACKAIPALQGLDKEYVGVMHLHKDVDDITLERNIKKFIGEIKQRPPVRSAVARKERARHVYSFEILDKDHKDVAFRVAAQAGTYVRTLCHQIGKEIGGANMTELRRIRAGRFNESFLVKMQDLSSAYMDWKENGDEKLREYVLPVEAAVEHLPKVIIKDSAVHSIANGSPLYTGGICFVQKTIKPGELTAIMSLKGELVALAKSALHAEEMIKRKALAVKTDRVIIEKGAYPKLKKE